MENSGKNGKLLENSWKILQNSLKILGSNGKFLENSRTFLVSKTQKIRMWVAKTYFIVKLKAMTELSEVEI